MDILASPWSSAPFRSAGGKRHPPAELLSLARSGDRSALARLLSMVEHGGPDARAIGRLTHPLGGHAASIGITRSPGSGKSTAVATWLQARARRTLWLQLDAGEPTAPLPVLSRARVVDVAAVHRLAAFVRVRLDRPHHVPLHAG